MFTPKIEGNRNSARALSIDHRFVSSYAATLQTADLAEVSLLEFVHTLDTWLPTAAAEQLGVLAEQAQSITAFTDTLGTLVLRHRDELRLLWPVRRLIADLGRYSVVCGHEDAVFIDRSGAGQLVPLPATAPDRGEMRWGYEGTGPINLYLALVYAVDHQVAPFPQPLFNDDPDSLYGWLLRQDKNAELVIEWPEVVRRVRADEPLRSAAMAVSRN